MCKRESLFTVFGPHRDITPCRAQLAPGQPSILSPAGRTALLYPQGWELAWTALLPVKLVAFLLWSLYSIMIDFKTSDKFCVEKRTLETLCLALHLSLISSKGI